MTPFHILACSSVHDLELYPISFDHWELSYKSYTKYRWGGGQHHCCMHFGDLHQLRLSSFFLRAITHSTLSRYWLDNDGGDNREVWYTKGKHENLLCVKQMHHPKQPVDWDHLLDEFGSSSDISFESTFIKTMQILVMCGMSMRAFSIWFVLLISNGENTT